MTGLNPPEELLFKKRFLRYLHHRDGSIVSPCKYISLLCSWVLALTRCSPELYCEFATLDQYLDKELSSKEEAEELEVVKVLLPPRL